MATLLTDLSMFSRRSTLRALLLGTLASRLNLSTGAKAANAFPQATLEPNGLRYSYYSFGWLPDAPRRQNLFQFELELLQTLPTSVDLRPHMPDVYDQHDIGSCTSNAIAACIQFVRKKNSEPINFRPSRLFIYYFGRQKEGTLTSDGGLSIADGIGVVLDKGVPPEDDWPYDGTAADSKNNFLPTSRAIAPPRLAIINEAGLHRTTDAWGVQQDLSALKACLAQGYPFMFGFTMYKSFYDNSKTPPLPLTHIPYPPSDDQPVGGHAVVAVGFIDDPNALPQDKGKKGAFICRNSWGLSDIGDRPMQDKGHFYMPYEYVLDKELASAFWTLRATT
jgi:C1A family cysteine protease